MGKHETSSNDNHIFEPPNQPSFVFDLDESVLPDFVNKQK